MTELTPVDYIENPLYLYCAGLYEGEGTIGASFNLDYRNGNKDKKPVRKLVLKISMTDIEPLYLFQDIMQLGTINGPYELKSGKYLYEYRVGTFDAVQLIIHRMYKYLSPRRKLQADSAICRYIENDYPGRET